MGPCGEEVEGGKGEGRLFGGIGGEITVQRGGLLCRLGPRAVFSGGSCSSSNPTTKLDS